MREVGEEEREPPQALPRALELEQEGREVQEVAAVRWWNLRAQQHHWQEEGGRRD